MSRVENIKVAVRVRPFNSREKSKECRNVVSMIDRTTLLTNPAHLKEPRRQFRFDYSYWSHDGYSITDNGYYEPDNEKYVDQKRLFDALGVGLLDNAWSGYNCTIFAYGQTGSGKSYSMMGYEPNRGMIPMLGESLFQGITKKKNPDVVFKVSISMLEIYNERVQDLLIGKKQPSQQGLTVRMSPKHGFYVEGLIQNAVSSCTDITYYIDQGNKNRTLAATKMNETSSRAHTIVIISFTQNFLKENKSKQSKIYMVDLAGSERAAQTGATGARFIESKNINRSLMTLGTVIKNLCAHACGRTDQGPTPYRDSKLTMLLKDAIGGNCKTIMVATISPSEEDYEQTLSTLRYADRVKSIRNVAIKNVEATDKLIKDLLAEKQALLSKLKSLPQSSTGYSEEDLKKLKIEQAFEIEQLKNEMQNAETAWQKRLQEAKKLMEKQLESEKQQQRDRRRIPHLWNLNEDPSLSQKIFHFIKDGETINVGNKKAAVSIHVELHGPSIAKHHAVLHNSHGDVSIRPIHGVVKVNGKPIKQQTTLKHQDRVFFGASNLFVLHLPSKQFKMGSKDMKKITYEMAQGEIARYLDDSKTNGVDWLKQEIAEMLLLTQESNAMAREMGKDIMFEPHVLAKHYGNDVKGTRVYILVHTGSGGEFLWGRNHFLDRYDLMTDMYQKFVDGDVLWQPTSPTQDPFWEPLETPTLVGQAYVPLESIAYMLDIEEQKIGIYDYQAGHAGYLNVALVPCTDTGAESSEENAVEEPTELLGQTITFKVKIKGATGIPKRFKTSWCHYTLLNDDTRYYTDEKVGVVPKYAFQQMHVMKHVGIEEVEYLENQALVIEVFGRQGSSYEHRRGSLLNAYTMSDIRRMSNVLPTTSISTLFDMGLTTDNSLMAPSFADVSEQGNNLDQQDKDLKEDKVHEGMGRGQEDIGNMIEEILNNMSEIDQEDDVKSGTVNSMSDVKQGHVVKSDTVNTMSDVKQGHVVKSDTVNSMSDVKQGHGVKSDTVKSMSDVKQGHVVKSDTVNSMSDVKQGHGVKSDTVNSMSDVKQGHGVKSDTVNSMSDVKSYTVNNMFGAVDPLEVEINKDDIRERATDTFTVIQKGISDLVDDIMGKSESPVDEVEEMLNLSSNTSLHVLREALQSTTKELKNTEKALTTASTKIEKIDKALINREDSLAMEIQAILEG